MLIALKILLFVIISLLYFSNAALKSLELLVTLLSLFFILSLFTLLVAVEE
jgi:hypothetical protein